jgi:hypothetical protein
LAVSPNGLWLAYASASRGEKNEIWVRPYGREGAAVRVSPDGGVEPVWARDGRELFYLETNRVMSVAVDTRAGFNFKPAALLFEGQFTRSSQPPSYDIAPDGRFLFLRAPSPSSPSPITVVLNWMSR